MIDEMSALIGIVSRQGLKIKKHGRNQPNKRNSQLYIRK